MSKKGKYPLVSGSRIFVISGHYWGFYGTATRTVGAANQKRLVDVELPGIGNITLKQHEVKVVSEPEFVKQRFKANRVPSEIRPQRNDPPIPPIPDRKKRKGVARGSSPRHAR